MAPTPSFPARMRAWREAADLTQTELAEMVGVSQGAVSDWETEELRLPHLRRAESLDKAFGLAQGTVARAIRTARKARAEMLQARGRDAIDAVLERFDQLEDLVAAGRDEIDQRNEDLADRLDRLEELLRRRLRPTRGDH